MEFREFDYKVFDRNLHRLMYRRGELKQKELSKLSGISEYRISRYTTGKRIPSINVLMRLANVLNCTIEDLVYPQ